jgi:hypothetical protein
MEFLLLIAFLFVVYKILSHKPPTSAAVKTPRAAPDEPDDDTRDAWEPFDYAAATLYPASGIYRIKYVDRNGLSSDREISVKRVLKNGSDAMIEARCFLRNAHRCFLQSRIQSAVDTESGEVVKNLATTAIANHKESPEGRIDDLLMREEEALCALLYVARADGRMMKAERLVIARYLKTMHPDVDVTETEIEVRLKQLWVPDSVAEFKRLLRRLKEEPARLRSVAQAASDIVATQKDAAPEETRALQLMAEALNKPKD